MFSDSSRVQFEGKKATGFLKSLQLYDLKGCSVTVSVVCLKLARFSPFSAL